MRIGILEDDPAICGLLHELLELHGHIPVIYRNGFDLFVAMIEEESSSLSAPFDVLIVDLLLPSGISGMQVIAQARRIYPQLPIVVISATSHLNLEDVKRWYPEVITFHKPFKLRDLLIAIEKEIPYSLPNL